MFSSDRLIENLYLSPCSIELQLNNNSFKACKLLGIVEASMNAEIKSPWISFFKSHDIKFLKSVFSEISFLRQEVTRCTNDDLCASQLNNQRSLDENFEFFIAFEYEKTMILCSWRIKERGSMTVG
ncbi:unnamed protein product [Vicia faba]|uniref:Uncharacterized protein n=1 Tax=Vicia faba TaxID=3906 RepID=A0AAV0ZS29_VICFA|nr:unnamed protein product [Vicia faba]